jgi:hypothetical protein
MKPRNPKKELKACWSKREGDVMIHYPNKPDGCWLHDMLNTKRLRSGSTKDYTYAERITIQDWNTNLCIYEGKSFLQELEERGYDVKTLKISVRRKEESCS